MLRHQDILPEQAGPEVAQSNRGFRAIFEYVAKNFKCFSLLQAVFTCFTGEGWLVASVASLY